MFVGPRELRVSSPVIPPFPGFYFHRMFKADSPDFKHRTIWSCFLPFFLKLFNISNYFNIFISLKSIHCITLRSHHWIHGLSRWHRWILKHPRWIFRSILESDSNLWPMSFDLEIWKMLERLPNITMEKKSWKKLTAKQTNPQRILLRCLLGIAEHQELESAAFAASSQWL